MAEDFPKWKPVAEATREALALLGYHVPACLPGEPEACGADFAHHTVGNLATLKAVVEDRIGHLGDGSAALVEEIYTNTLATLRAEPCDQGHHQVGGEG